MEKWSEQRIEAYKRYIEHDKKKLASWRRELEEAENRYKIAKHAIKNFEESIKRDRAELAAQGVEY